MISRHATVFEQVVERLSDVRPATNGVSARCPAHDDHNPSLSVSEGKHGVLVYCHAGCTADSVVRALDLELRDLFYDRNHSVNGGKDHLLSRGLEWIDTYEYFDPDGTLRFQVLRLRDEKGNKTFRQRRPDPNVQSGWAWTVSDLPERQRALPYRLPEVLRAIHAGDPVWIAEGEKDVEALRKAGVAATCNAGGAGEGKWTSRHSEYLRGADVIITRDRDEAGVRHQAIVARSLDGIAGSVRLVEPAKGKDAADHLAAGHSLNEFVPLEIGAVVQQREPKHEEIPRPAQGAASAYGGSNAGDEARHAGSSAPIGGVSEQTSTLTDEALAAIGARPPAPAEGDPYADSPISERVVADAFQGRWLWTPSLGWMAWTGCIWEARPDVAAAEVVRRWIDGEVARIALQGHQKETARAAAMQAENRITRILRLCRGQVLANAADFDADPDVLVCLNGVIELRTGELMEHDPARLVTRMTDVEYRPCAEHSDWTKALAALPMDVRGWLQLRLGQAATGHTPDDDRMLFFLGSGENGKTTLLAAVMSALGAYAGLVPDRLLLASPDAHPTEMMSLRGLRMAVIEETPEGRRLSVARLKKSVGTPWITARLVYRDSTTFKATHALFLSSNYRPVIEETDHGTWRRLGLVTFPYRFVKQGAELTAPTDRHGDPLLRTRLHEQSRQEAILAWLVQGARAWYDAGSIMPPLPERIDRDNHAWRAETDSVLAYATERLEADLASCVLAKDLLSDLNQWLAERGQQEWSDRTVAARFGTHEWVTDRDIEKKQVRHRPEALSRSYYRCAPGPVPASYKAWAGVKFRSSGVEEGAVSAVSSSSVLSPSASRAEILEDPKQAKHASGSLLKVAR